MKFQFYQDPGHGWVKVKRDLLKELGIEHKISSYSYQKGEWVYLEEDCDLSELWNKLKEIGTNMEFDYKRTNNSSRIRSYDSFRPQGSTQQQTGLALSQAHG